MITRADKQAITREELKTHWQEKTDSLGLDFESMIKISHEKAQVIKGNRDKVKRMEALSRQAVIYAARHLAERQFVFSRDDMGETAFSYAFGDVTPQTINDAVTQEIGDD